ncbi:hypothetical protein AB0B01_21830 [Streptomyces sp. NPDC044571]|uniref:hypothetical protein n=1 Tax=Streptomyces sp. NPDC044571 TaxID=3155371 RepID=UPI0033EA4443
MTEPQHPETPAPAQAPEAAALVPAPAAEPSGKAPRALSRKAVALIAGGIGLAVLAGGGIAASVALEHADRTAPTRYWTAEGSAPQKPEEAAPVPANELSGKLLPVPSNFTLGPDLAQDGNNFFVSGEKAVQGFKDARNGLSSSERKQRDEMLAGLKLKGLAGRSYTKGGGEAVYQVRIMQADPKAVGAFSEMSKKLLDLTGDDREAPAVDGYPDAKCALVAIGEEKKEKIDSMDCVAVQGDVLVNFRAFGAKPFSHSDAVAFFKNQLSHLKSPGESV